VQEAGVGLEHIAVGREKEIAALLQDLENIAEGGAAFRFVGALRLWQEFYVATVVITLWNAGLSSSMLTCLPNADW